MTFSVSFRKAVDFLHFWQVTENSVENHLVFGETSTYRTGSASYFHIESGAYHKRGRCARVVVRVSMFSEFNSLLYYCASFICRPQVLIYLPCASMQFDRSKNCKMGGRTYLAPKRFGNVRCNSLHLSKKMVKFSRSH